MKFLIGLALLVVLSLPSGRKPSDQVTRPVITAFRLDSPYERRSHAYWGQLHVHTTESDGRQSPREMVRFYQRADYDFVSLTDHLTITPDPKVPGILFLKGIEDNADQSTGEQVSQHINRIGAKHMAPSPRSQADIFSVARQEGSLAFINHPNWPGKELVNPGWSDEDLLNARGYGAMEVWNASVGTDDGRRADLLLRTGRRVKLMATDDCHDLHDPTCATTRTVVYADELSERAIMAALHAGNYYSSAGAFMSVHVRDKTIQVDVTCTSEVEFIGGADGKVLKRETVRTSAEYRVRGDDVYVRVRVTERLHGNRAWSNPIYVIPDQ